MNGGFVVRLFLVAAAALCCTQLIRGRAPALAILISLAAVMVLLGMLLPKLQALWQAFQSLLTGSGLQSELFEPVVKVIAITQISHIGAELCRDAGERAIAAKLELCGAAASLLSVLPLAQRALELIGALGT